MDPYYDVKTEIEASLQTLHQLHASYKRILATLPESHHGTSEELRTARLEVWNVLEAVEGDVADVEESVRVAEMRGVPVEEIRRRRAFVKRVQKECHTIRSSFTDPESSTHTASPPSYSSPYTSGSSTPLRSTQPNASSSLDPLARTLRSHPLASSNTSPRSNSRSDNINGDDDLDGKEPSAHFYERQTQQLMIQQQDETLTSIGSTVGVLREQAWEMGREIGEQVRLVEELEEGVDRTEGRMGRAGKLMERFIQENKNDKSSWCVLILIIVLCILLIAIILT